MIVFASYFSFFVKKKIVLFQINIKSCFIVSFKHLISHISYELINYLKIIFLM